jgi:hypothetical protein
MLAFVFKMSKNLQVDSGNGINLPQKMASDEFVIERHFAITLCGPDGQKVPQHHLSITPAIELLSPRLKPSEAFMVLQYRRTRDLE